jgi:hypothetical protein
MHGGHFSDGTSRRASASVGRALTQPPPQVHRFRETATSRVSGSAKMLASFFSGAPGYALPPVPRISVTRLDSLQAQ